MAQELKTKSIPEIGCLWTYFGVLWTYVGVRWTYVGVLWTYFGRPWMTLDDLGVHLQTAGTPHAKRESRTVEQESKIRGYRVLHLREQ